MRRAIEIDRQLPVLVLTECFDMSCYLEAMQLGAAEYVEKPLRADQVARLVETHIRRREHEIIVTGDNYLLVKSRLRLVSSRLKVMRQELNRLPEPPPHPRLTEERLVGPLAPLVIGGVRVLRGAIALAAWARPTWRAARVGPVAALKEE